MFFPTFDIKFNKRRAFNKAVGPGKRYIADWATFQAWPHVER